MVTSGPNRAQKTTASPARDEINAAYLTLAEASTATEPIDRILAYLKAGSIAAIANYAEARHGNDRSDQLALELRESITLLANNVEEQGKLIERLQQQVRQTGKE